MPKILIVDDEWLTRLEIEEMLTDLGYDVAGQAETGAEAISKARELNPDLILMDVKMPGGMTGIDAARKIKAELGTPIVFISGYGDPEHIEAAKEIAPFGYVMKPFDEREVHAFIEIALSRKKLELELEESHERLEQTNLDLRKEIAARKNTEMALRESEEKYSKFFHSNPQWLHISTVEDGRYVEVNDAVKEITGYERDEIIGRTSKELGLWADYEERSRLAKVALEQGGFREQEVAIIKKNGEPVSLLWSAATIEIMGAVHFLNAVTDITELNQTQEALRESEKKYHGLFDESIAAVYLFDEKKNFIDSNQAGLDLLGYSRDELLTMSVSDVDADSIVALPAQDQVLSGNRIINYEHKLKRKDGKVITVLNNSGPLTNNNGQVVGMQSTLIDITERKRAEDKVRKAYTEVEKRVEERTIELSVANAGLTAKIAERKRAEKALQESEEKYRSLITNIPDVTWTTDYEGKTSFVSPNVEEQYGYTPEEIYTGDDNIWLGRIHPEDTERVEKAFRELFEEGTMFDVEYRIKGKNGKWIWLHDRSIAIYERDGVMYADGIFTNITERKRMAEVLQRSEEHHHSFMESAKGFIVYRLEVDPENYFSGRLIFVSPGIEDEIGVSPEAEFSEWFKSVHPDDLPALIEAQSKSVQNGDTFDQEFRWKNLMGGWRWCHAISNPVFDSEGKPKYFNGMIIDVTPQKQAEKSLQESERHLRSLMENATNFAVYRLISDDNPSLLSVIFVSPSITDIMGVSEPMSFETWFEHVHPDDVERIVKANIEAFKTLRFDETMRIYHPREQKWIWIHSISTGFEDPERQRYYVNGILIDVTKEKEAEEALRESEKRLNAILDATTETIVLFDREGIVHAANQVVCDRLETTKEEFIGKRIYDFFSPDVAEGRKQKWHEVLDTGRPVSFEDTRKNMTFEQKAYPILDEEGQVQMVVAFANDKTDRNLAEEALRESQQRMALAMEGGNIGMFDWNLQTNEAFFDRRWYENVGYSPGDVELNPGDWEKITHSEDWPGAQQMLKDNLRGKIPFYEKETRLKCKSGQWRWMLTRAKIVEFDSNGDALRIIGTTLDTNNRKRMEIELQNRTLELSETNTALKVLVNHREKDKEELGEKVLSNVKALVEPYLKELKDSQVDQKQIVFLDLLESGLKNILSSFSSKLSSKYLALTPGELQVAYLVREGKRTKEIAELLNLSGKTIEDYRKNLRKKLGIRNMKVNLRTYLLSVPQ